MFRALAAVIKGRLQFILFVAIVGSSLVPQAASQAQDLQFSDFLQLHMTTEVEPTATSSDEQTTSLDSSSNFALMVSPDTMTTLPCDSTDNLTMRLRPPQNIEGWWERVADPRTGIRMSLTNAGFMAEFKDTQGERVPVDLAAVSQAFSLEASLPYDGERFLDCTDPAAQDVERRPWSLNDDAKDVRYFLGYHDMVISYFGELKKGCEYTLHFRWGPYTEDGRCLAASQTYPFWVNDGVTPFERETENRIYDLATLRLRAFTMKEGTAIKPDEIWKRYYDQFGIMPQQIRQVGSPRVNENKPEEALYTFQQYYEDYPIIGAVYQVQTTDGYVRSVSGEMFPDFRPTEPLDTGAIVESETALQNALFAIAAEQYSWEKYPEMSAPTADVPVWLPTDVLGREIAGQLAWHFEIPVTKPPNHYAVYVDAYDPNGRILQMHSNIPYILYKPETETTITGDWEPFGVAAGEAVFDKDVAINISRGNDVDGNVLFALVKTALPVLNPPIITLYASEDGNLDYIVDPDGNNLFDGRDGQTADETIVYPEQRLGVSVHWAVEKVIEYLRSFLDKVFWIGFDRMGLKPIYSLLINDSSFWEREGGALASQMLAFCDIYSNPYPTLNFNLTGNQPTLAVAPNVVGHEFCHGIMLHANHGLPYEGEGILIHEGFCFSFESLFEFFVREDADFVDPAKGLSADWCGRAGVEAGEPCNWLFDDPQASVPMRAATYKSDFYRQLDTNCPDAEGGCWHSKATIIPYAVSMMVDGDVGQNGIGCQYFVDPLANDAKESRRKAGYILAETMTRGDLSPSVADAAWSMAEAARRLYPDVDGLDSPEVETVKDAWHAVGVMGLEEIKDIHVTPRQASLDVNPWPVRLAFEIPENAIPGFEIQLATDQNFTQDVITKSASMTEGNDLRVEEIDGVERHMLGTDFFLEPNRVYYWRWRDIPEGWPSCGRIYAFATGSLKPQLIAPRGIPRLDGSESISKVAPWEARLEWKAIPGTAYYEVHIVEPSSGYEATYPTCDQKEHEQLVSIPVPTVEQFTTRVPAPENGSRVSARFVLKGEKDYYAWVRAIGPDDMTSECAQIHFQTKEEDPPFVGAGSSPGDRTVRWGYDESPLEFSWGTTEGAESYRLQVTNLATNYQTIDKTIPTPSAESDWLVYRSELETEDFGNYCYKVTANSGDDARGYHAILESDEKCFNIEACRMEIETPQDGDVIGRYGDSKLYWRCGYASNGFWLTMQSRKNDSKDWETIVDGPVAQQDESVEGRWIYDFSNFAYFGYQFNAQVALIMPGPGNEVSDQFKDSVSFRIETEYEHKQDLEAEREAEAQQEAEEEASQTGGTSSGSSGSGSCEVIAAPTLVSPMNYAQVGTHITVQWNEVPDATHYQVLMSVKSSSGGGELLGLGEPPVYPVGNLLNFNGVLQVVPPYTLNGSTDANGNPIYTYECCVKALKGSKCEFNPPPALSGSASCASGLIVR